MGSSSSHSNDPEEVFEDLFQQFKDNYVGFACRRVDWQKQYDKHRPRVKEDTTQEELISVLKDMLAPTKDGHINLTCEEIGLEYNPMEAVFKFRGDFSGDCLCDPKKEEDFCYECSPKPNRMQQFFKMVDGALSSAGFGEPTLLLDGIFSYCRSENVGYLRVMQFQPAKEPPQSIICRIPAMMTWMKAWEDGVDEILTDFESTSGIILDLRGNSGGFDDRALSLASRFVAKKVPAYSTKTKKGPADDDFDETVEYSFNAEDDGRVKYMDRPIFVLTCDGTFSAGEVLSLLMAQLPNVFMLGEKTYGCFSDMTPFTLCNGWNVTMSNMIYCNAAGICYEGSGVPVDFIVPNSKADLDNGSDPVVKEALRRLSSPNPLSGNGRR